MSTWNLGLAAAEAFPRRKRDGTLESMDEARKRRAFEVQSAGEYDPYCDLIEEIVELRKLGNLHKLVGRIESMFPQNPDITTVLIAALTAQALPERWEKRAEWARRNRGALVGAIRRVRDEEIASLEVNRRIFHLETIANWMERHAARMTRLARAGRWVKARPRKLQFTPMVELRDANGGGLRRIRGDQAHVLCEVNVVAPDPTCRGKFISRVVWSRPRAIELPPHGSLNGWHVHTEVLGYGEQRWATWSFAENR